MAIQDFKGTITFPSAGGSITAMATAAEVLAGTEAAKAIAPDQLATALFAAISDIPYATAAGKPGKLTKGAADTKLFMNAGATAPEWASGVFIGTTTRDLTSISADVAYTGVGFKPSAIIAFSAVGGFLGIGMDNITTKGTGYLYGTTPVYEIGSSFLLKLIYTSGDYQTAIVKTFDADGFTLTWTKTLSPSGSFSIYYLALR